MELPDNRIKNQNISPKLIAVSYSMHRPHSSQLCVVCLFFSQRCIYTL